MEFKVGDRVRVKNTFEGTNLTGRTGTIRDVRDRHKVGVAFDEHFGGCYSYTIGGITYPYFRVGSEEELELLAGHTLKNPTCLIIWNEDRDPHQFFSDEKEAKEFIKKLSDKPSVRKDSILFIRIKSAQQVKITKNLRFGSYKI